MKKQTKYQWQGEDVKVVFGNCIVKEVQDKPLWWYNYECNIGLPKGMACIPTVQITTKDKHTFMLSNHYGIAVHKLINGGWPNFSHFSIDGVFSTIPQLKFKKFELPAYEQHESDRRRWQKENFPHEHTHMEAMRAIIKRKPQSTKQ